MRQHAEHSTRGRTGYLSMCYTIILALALTNPDPWKGTCPKGCKNVDNNCVWSDTGQHCLDILPVKGASIFCQTGSDTQYHIMGMTTGPNSEAYGYWDNQGGDKTDEGRNPDIRGFTLRINTVPGIERITANRGKFPKQTSDFKFTELLIYSRQLTQKESQQVVNYLRYKYFSDSGAAPLLEPSTAMKTVKFRTHQLQTHDFMCLLSNDATYIKVSDIEIHNPDTEATAYSSASIPSMQEIYDSLSDDEVLDG